MAKSLLSLLIEQGPKSGHCLQCKGRVTIGRGRANTLQISKDVGISQKHLAFYCVNSCEKDDAGGWSVTDLGSSNGTLVNNLLIEPNLPISIKAGALIKIGAETTIRVSIPSSDLETSKVMVLPKCKSISKHADSLAKVIPVLEAHHKTRAHILSAVQNRDKLAEGDLDMHNPSPEKDHSKHILPSEENHSKHGEHHRAGVSKERGGQEPELDESKCSAQGIDLSMTVEQWFAQLMEEGPKYLYQVSESMIQDILLESKQFDEYVWSLNQG